jgi:hypothetical protein
MTRRKPLAWDDATRPNLGVAGKFPACGRCCDLLFMPGFTEAVYSVSIEHPGDPADLARRTIESYHERRHPAGEWGLGETR